MPTLLHEPDVTQPLDPVVTDLPTRNRRRWVLGSLAVLAGVAAAGVGLRLAHPGVLPGVTLSGTEVGGMERGELRSFTEELAASATAEPVTVSYEGTVTTLAPTDVTYELDAEASAESAWSVGRTGNPVVDTWHHVQALFTTNAVAVVDTVDEPALRAWTDDAAEAIDRQVGDGGLIIDPETFDVQVDPPTAGYETDREALYADVRAALGLPAPRELTAPVEVTPVQVDPASVEAVARMAEQVLTDDVTLTASGTTITLSPSQVAPLLTVEAEGSRAQLAVSAGAVEEHLADVATQLTIAPVDASFDVPREPAVTLEAKENTSFEPVDVDVDIVPGTPGRTFDAGVVADAMGERLRAGGRSVTVELPVAEPQRSTEDLEAMNVTQLLGTFTTHFAPGEPRVVNIRHLADVLDGAVIAPGEQFSINRTSGERTCDKGYAKDGMIYNGELVKVCGGGVSQVGTAVFNAAFFAGVQIDQHKPHSWYISRYPVGREATLDFDTDIDVKFTNDTGNGLVLRTDHSETHLTVSLYGTSDVERVSAEHGPRTNVRSAPTSYVENPRVPFGSQRVVDAGHGGFDIDVTRIVDRVGEDEAERQTWSHRYVTSPRIIHRNTQTPPSPEPTPSSPEEQGKPSPQPSTQPQPSTEPQPSSKPKPSEQPTSAPPPTDG